MAAPSCPSPSAAHVWAQLVEVDWLSLHVLVDNETEGLSTPCLALDPRATPPSHMTYTSEFTSLTKAFLEGRLEELDFRRSLLAGHGLSVLLTTGRWDSPAEGQRDSGATGVAGLAASGTGGSSTTPGTMGGTDKKCVQHVLLFDGGPRPELWSTNVGKLDLDLAPLEAVVLSHWHTDHSAGLSAVASMCSAARSAATSTTCRDVLPSFEATAAGTQACAAGGTASGGTAAPGLAAVAAASEEVVFDVHPKRPARRGFRAPDGRAVPFSEDVSWRDLQLPHCRVDRHTEPHLLLDDCFFVSGEIPRVTEYEKGLTNHQTQQDDGTWVPDPLIMDERYLAVKVRGVGAVVLSACSHAGIINVARHVCELQGGAPPAVLVGGLHLSGAECETRVGQTVADLASMDPPPVVLAGHCTGWRAKAALAAVLPGRFQSCAVGGRYDFGSRVPPSAQPS